ncbi:MAG: LysR family transcriptional regulator, partial [Pseudomonadota bacterium]
MQNIDLMALDGRSLRVFLVVFEEMSVSKAAQRLDLTQSTVSHILDKLRNGLGDPLF